MDDQKLQDFVNQSGFPLQIAISQTVESNTKNHGWKVLYSEHAWQQDHGEEGFIDLVLEDQYRTSVLVVECKRVLDTTWVFLQPNNETSTESTAKLWVSYANSDKVILGWAEMSNHPTSHQSSFCVVPGQDSKARPMLERNAANLISATAALALEERENFQLSPLSVRMYGSVLVTTATLKVCSFDPSNISITDGKINESQFSEVDFVRFRKQLSSDSLMNNASRPESATELASAKEHTVFVVNAKALNTFLKNWTVHSGPLNVLIGRM